MTQNDSLAYWDSCVFIDRIEAKNLSRIDVLRAMTDAAERGELKIVSSTLSMAEVVKLSNLTDIDNESKEQLIVDFFDNDYIHVRNIDPRISWLARKIIRDHNLKPPDAIHVATAILNHVEVLHTYDDVHLTPLSNKIHYKDVWDKSLRIENPKWSWQPILPEVPEVLAKAEEVPSSSKEDIPIDSQTAITAPLIPSADPTEASSDSTSTKLPMEEIPK
ncbi:MAG: type II toxin-antitoxin system VapC family toxin [Bryobacteraceae bacterium]